mgnify:FL=1
MSNTYPSTDRSAKYAGNLRMKITLSVKLDNITMAVVGHLVVVINVFYLERSVSQFDTNGISADTSRVSKGRQ